MWKLTTLCFFSSFSPFSPFLLVLLLFSDNQDIAITTTKTLVLEYPLFIVQPSVASRSPYKHDLDAPTRFGVLPRHPHKGEVPKWVGLNLFLDPNTAAIEYVLTFHLLYRHLLYRHLLYRHLLLSSSSFIVIE